MMRKWKTLLLLLTLAFICTVAALPRYNKFRELEKQENDLEISNLVLLEGLMSSDYKTLIFNDDQITESHATPKIYKAELCRTVKKITSCTNNSLVSFNAKSGFRGNFVMGKTLIRFEQIDDEQVTVKPDISIDEIDVDFLLKPSSIKITKPPDEIFPSFQYSEVFPIYKNDGQKVDFSIELLVVNDVQRANLFGKNVDEIVQHTLDVLALVNQLYSSEFFEKANLKIVLSAQIIFMNDVFAANSDANAFIGILNAWRNENFATLPRHDIVHLFSGVDFNDNILGLAYLNSICDVEVACQYLDPGFCFYDEATDDFTECCLRWGAALSTVSLDMNSARTVAHEIGHQLGFRHDVDDSTRGCSSSGGIMAAITTLGSNWLDDTWNPCVTEAFDNVLLNRHSVFDIYNYHAYGCLLNQVQATNETLTFDSNKTDGDPSGSSRTHLLTGFTMVLVAMCAVFSYLKL